MTKKLSVTRVIVLISSYLLACVGFLSSPAPAEEEPSRILDGTVFRLSSTPRFEARPFNQGSLAEIPSAVHLQDIDGDRRDDLLLYSKRSGVLHAMRNRDGALSPPEQLLVLPPSRTWERFFFEDLDRDGRIDIVAIPTDGRAIAVLRGGETASDADVQELGELHPRDAAEVQLVDLDGDGRLELVGITASLFWWHAEFDGTRFASATTRERLPSERYRLAGSGRFFFDRCDSLALLDHSTLQVFAAVSGCRPGLKLVPTGSVLRTSTPRETSAHPVPIEHYTVRADGMAREGVLFFLRPEGAWFQLRCFGPEFCLTQPWGEIGFPPRFDHAVAVGDFTGDAVDDVIGGTPASRRWELLAARSDAAERVAAEVPFQGADWRFVQAGYIDEDELEDLVAFSVSRKQWYFARSLVASPLSGAHVLNAFKPAATTDEEGRFELPAASGDAIAVLAPGMRISPPLRIVGHGKLSFLAVERPEQGPFVCNGYLGERDPLGRVRLWGQSSYCPAGHVMIAVDDVGMNVSKKRSAIEPMATCCRVPHSDMLLDEHRYEPGACPEDHVLTGYEAPRTEAPYRCTKINTTRYELGNPRPALYWGFGYTRWEEGGYVNKEEIPAALRSAVGRISRRKWDVDGCVGYPWGSALTGITSGSCDGMQFRQIQLRSGDSSSTPLPVEMFLSCEMIEGVFSSRPRCADRER